MLLRMYCNNFLNVSHLWDMQHKLWLRIVDILLICIPWFYRLTKFTSWHGKIHILLIIIFKLIWMVTGHMYGLLVNLAWLFNISPTYLNLKWWSSSVSGTLLSHSHWLRYWYQDTSIFTMNFLNVHCPIQLLAHPNNLIPYPPPLQRICSWQALAFHFLLTKL
jgi:hypothetical protein